MDLDGHHSRWGGVTSLGTSSGANTAIPAAQFTLAPGKTAATLQYTIVAIDDFTPCQQTQNIIVRINEYPDNVIDADCYDTPPPMVWGIRSAYSSADGVSPLNIPLVGDLNDDDIPEIVCFGITGRTDMAGSVTKEILVFDGQTHARTAFGLPSYVTEYDGAAYGLVKTSARQGLIIVAMTNYKLYAYTMDGTPVWTSRAGENYGSATGDFAVNIAFADFNQDGHPEVIVRNKIYDAETGYLLATAAGGSNTGSSWAHWSHSTNRKLSSPVAADIMGDGALDLILGNEVYSVNINNRNGTAGNSVSRINTIAPPAGVVADGHAQVADFNNDGHLDILISNRNVAGTIGIVSVYVWDVFNNTVSTPLQINTNVSGKSIPLIADIDKNGNMDIVIQCAATGTTEKIRAYEYDAASGTFSFMWGIVPDEDSYSNSCTLFDFNQDGLNEVLITDQTNIRIFNGSGKSHITGQDTVPVYEMARLNYIEATIMQYPVIADADGDGAAEIVAIGGGYGNGTLNIFKSSTTPWAPARKVWNQYSYNAVNVNEDLTIPISQLNPATKFSGKDNTLGTDDDVRPYNGFLMQQTLIGRNGLPIWTLPNAEYNADPLYDYYSDGDSLRISIDVINMGDAPLQSPFYISVYRKGASTTETLVKTDSIMQVIAVNSTAQKVISIKDLSSFLPFDSLIVRLNDEGQGKYVQLECDTAGNRTGEARWKVMRVNTDLATVQKYYSVDIPVLANDSLPASLFSGSFYLGDSVSIPPTAGTLTAVGSGASSKLVYTNHGDPLANNIDSFQYRITFLHPVTSAYRTLTAWVYIYVLDDLNGAAGCYGQPHTVNLSARPAGTTFDWWYNTGGTQLSPPGGSTRVVTNITADTTFQIRPNVPLTRYSRWGEFPRGYFTIKPANTGGTVATMRWTGLADSLWHNPANWVAVRSMANGSMYETPVSYAPTKCVNVIIPSIVGNFPELVDSAWCNDILMEDRAMLKNPHVLNYRNASVELKLKPSERDRFIMWSAPLSQMVTGDYHYKGKAGEPQFGDFFMNFFQQSNPDNSGSAAAQSNFTTTFGSVEQPLQLGKAFNLRVVTTSLSRDSILRFPGETDTYNGIQLDPRPGKYKFVTQGVLQDALGRFNLPVYSGLGSSYDNSGWKLIQVVNPYMAYLRADSFLLYNPALQSGYYYWNGELDGSFTTVGVSGTGNRFVYTEQSAASLPNLIAPLQSFFVAKASQNSQVPTVVMSPRWTTASPPASYTLRSTQVTSGGILYIKAIQGSRTSSAALVYDPEATSKADLPVLVYNEIPLTLYAFSPGREALSIRTSNDFQSQATDLGLRVMNAGEMKLEFSGLSTFGHDVYLQDKQLGKTINLQNNPVYTFTVAKSGTNAIELNDRFSLEMAYTGRGIVTGNESAPSPAALQVSSKDGYLNVQSQGEKIDQLQVYSLTGKLIYSNSSSSDRFSIPLPGGVYIVKGLTGTTYCTEKAIVR